MNQCSSPGPASRSSEITEFDWVDEGKVYTATQEDMKCFKTLIRNIKTLRYFDFGAVRVIPPAGYHPTTKSWEELKTVKLASPYFMKIGRAGEKSYFTESDKVGETEVKTVGDLWDKGTKPAELVQAGVKELEMKCWEKIRVRGASRDPKSLCTYGTDENGTLMKFGSDEITFNNIPNILSEVMHRYSRSPIGLTCGLLYYGKLYTTFVNHTEDYDLYAASYLHYGNPKLWYTNKPADAQQIEEKSNKDLKNYLKNKSVHQCKKIFRHKGILMDLKFYHENKIRVYRQVQKQGEFVIVPPQSYHFGFNLGNNVAEAINFAYEDWIPYGLLAKNCSTLMKKDSSLKLRMEYFVYEYMHSKMTTYLNGQLEMVHPDDPSKTPRKVRPPTALEELHEATEYFHLVNGIDKCIAFITFHGVEYVFVVIGGIRSWVTRVQLEQLTWNNNGALVKIPDSYFSTDRNIPPPILVDGVEMSGRNFGRLYDVEADTPSESAEEGDDLDSNRADVETRTMKRRRVGDTLDVGDNPGGQVDENDDDFDDDGTDERLETCPICAKPLKFGRKFNRLRHLKACRLGKKFKCTQCGRGFKSIFSLNRHIKDNCKPVFRSSR